MTRNSTIRNCAIALSLLSACGSDTPGGPTTPTLKAPDVAGSYTNYQFWLVQFRRLHDGYQGSWTCSGSMTLSQTAGTGVLSGFAVVGAPCPALSFELSGAVQPGGTINLQMSGPRPGAGTCPAPPSNTPYTGTLVSNRLSLRGSTDVECPGAGEGTYHFDIITAGYK